MTTTPRNPRECRPRTGPLLNGHRSHFTWRRSGASGAARASQGRRGEETGASGTSLSALAQGFTLIELVVVLFLLSLAAGLVLPAVGRGVEALELRAQVAGFAAFLRYGREQAITRRTPHEVRVDPETRELTLFAAGSESPRVRKQLSSRIQISAEPPTAQGVSFSPYGFSSGARFRLEGPGGRVYRVTVDPLTGRVSSLRES